MKGSKPSQQIQLPTFQFQDTFWIYNNYDTKELENYLNVMIPQLQLNIPKFSIQEGYLHLCKHFNFYPHPLLLIKQQKTTIPAPVGLLGEQSIDSIKNTTEISQFLVLQNNKLDKITLTLLYYLWPLYSNLNVLKIYNTQFTNDELEIISKIIKDNKLIKLFIEYVNILPKIICPTLTQLYIRGNQILLQDLQEILQPGKFPQLQVIELSDNPLTKEYLQIIGTFMKKKNNLQYLGFSRCEIQAWEDLKPILETIGQEKLNEQKLQSYRDLEEKRDKQIKDQLKQKKKEFINDIELEPLIQNSDGTFSIIHNQQFQLLYLSVNPIKDTDKDQIEKFINTNPTVNIVLQGSQIETKTKERLKKKYQNIIF